MTLPLPLLLGPFGFGFGSFLFYLESGLLKGGIGGSLGGGRGGGWPGFPFMHPLDDEHGQIAAKVADKTSRQHYADPFQNIQRLYVHRLP